MAANSSISFATPDFDTLKASFKEFLRSQTVFKDYNFEASNMSALLNVLALNTHMNTFYLNMALAERFLDSAQIRDSVVSKSKELNYVPMSRRSSSATINLSITSNGLTTMEMPKGTQFSGRNGNSSYVFSTDRTVIAKSSNGVFNFDDVELLEGAYFQEAYVVDYDSETQRFIISNPDIDTNSLIVNVIEDGTTTVYSKASSLFDLTTSSKVFFIQACENNRYELEFGNNVLGKRPLNGAVVQIVYRVSSGAADADGVETFVLDEDIAAINGGSLDDISIETVAVSSGGAEREAMASIKFNAPRHFATQERAVTRDDYESLIRTNFSGVIEDVNVYGGELVEPKKYGRVIIAMKPLGGTIVPDYVKDQVLIFVRKYNAGAIRPVIADPEYFYLDVTTNVQFDTAISQYTSTDITTLITNEIVNFTETNLERFGNDFRYSKFVTAVDATDESIVSNDTSVKMIKRLTPKLNVATSFVIDFGNQAATEGDYYGKAPPDQPAITSSPFTYVDVDDVSHPFSYIQDNGAGTLLIYKVDNNQEVVLNTSAGTVNYVTGQVNLNQIKVSDYTSYISLYYETKNKDIVINNEKILLIDVNDVHIDIEEVVR